MKDVFPPGGGAQDVSKIELISKNVNLFIIFIFEDTSLRNYFYNL